MAEPEVSRDAAYLISKGWRLVRKISGFSPAIGHKVGWQAWEHPDHQPDRHGFFQKGEALAHQKQIDRGLGCDCIQVEAREP